MSAAEALNGLPLVDHHCHGVVLDDVDTEGFLGMLTEGADSLVRGLGEFDSQVGVAVRRWCAPVIGLPSHATAEAYLARRPALRVARCPAGCFGRVGSVTVLVDTGLSGPRAVRRWTTWPRPREPTLTRCLGSRPSSRTWPRRGERCRTTRTPCTACRRRARDGRSRSRRRGLPDRSRAAGRPPAAAEVRHAAQRWLRRCETDGGTGSTTRRSSRTVSGPPPGRTCRSRSTSGYGDTDLTLHRCDPLLLTDFVRATSSVGVPLVLLHCYPYHRQAAYLANVYAQVVVDVRLALGHVGLRSTTVLAEMLELAPFGSLLYASDGAGLAELHHLGAVLFRDALGRLLDGWVVEDAMSAADAERYAAMIGADNARRIYGPALGRS